LFNRHNFIGRTVHNQRGRQITANVLERRGSRRTGKFGGPRQRRQIEDRIKQYQALPSRRIGREHHRRRELAARRFASQNDPLGINTKLAGVPPHKLKRVARIRFAIGQSRRAAVQEPVAGRNAHNPLRGQPFTMREEQVRFPLRPTTAMEKDHRRP